jgi:uncharacterized protein YycO
MDTLQSGDLIWPKMPGETIPYKASGETNLTDRELWELERNQYIATLRSKSSLTDIEIKRIEMLNDMSYDTYMKYFTEDVPVEETVPLGEIIGVGHVAIVRIVDGNISIVEAMREKGVREISYQDWILERRGQIFWHGRLKSLDSTLRANVARLAYEQVGKPYKFFNFNLEDTSGFYCSKLAWLTIRDASNIVADDKPNPNRILWFSPKRLLRSTHIDILQNPGNYGVRFEEGQK